MELEGVSKGSYSDKPNGTRRQQLLKEEQAKKHR